MKYSNKKTHTLIACLNAKVGKKTPLKVTHYITDRCNLLCDYCYAKKFQKGPNEMTTQQVKDAMKEFSELGTTTWTLIGGEPLVRSDIGEIIDYGKKLGLVVNIVTNASFVPQKLDHVCKVDNVFMSLDGNKEIHDAIRGKGSYDAVVKAIDLIRGRGKPVIINSVVSKENYSYLDKLSDFAKQKGCFINFNPTYNLGPGSDKFMLSFDEIKYATETIKRLKKDNPHIISSIGTFERSVDFTAGKVTRYQKHCLAGTLYLALSPSGEVGPCFVRLAENGWTSGVKEGWYNAFDKVGDMSKCTCDVHCFYDLNELFGLNPKALMKATFNIASDKGIYA